MKPIEIVYNDFDSPGETTIVVSNAKEAVEALNKVPWIIQSKDNLDEDLSEIKNSYFILSEVILCLNIFIKLKSTNTRLTPLHTSYFFVLSRLFKNSVSVVGKNPLFDVSSIVKIFTVNVNDLNQLNELLSQSLSIQIQLLGILSSFAVNPNKDKFVCDIFWFIHNELDIYPKEHIIDQKAIFNSTNSNFSIGDINIYIDPDSNQDELLRLFFESKSNSLQEWPYDEIAKELKQTFSDERRKAYYNCLYQLKRKMKENGINDFFSSLTMHKVQINDKYLT